MTLKQELVVVDVETTGDDPFVHDLLAVALVPVVGTTPPLEVFVKNLNPRWTECGEKNFQQFSAEWTLKAVAPAEAMQAIEKYLQRLLGSTKATLVGHNVAFDIAFLRKLADQTGHSYGRFISHRSLDTHTLLYLGSLEGRLPPSARTSDGAFKTLGISTSKGKRHTAIGDAVSTKELFLKLVALLSAEHADVS